MQSLRHVSRSCTAWAVAVQERERRQPSDLACTCRKGIHAAVAEATSAGVTHTVLFFPDGRRFNRQLRSYERRWLADFLPNKVTHTLGGPFTCARVGCSPGLCVCRGAGRRV